MDLMTLNANNQPAKLIENWDGLIWAERYNTVGDFQLRTGAVSTFMNLLPEGTRLTLRESNHVMSVETHEIERKKNAPESLVIKGRSFESVLDRRVAIQSISASTGSTNWTVNSKTPSDVAYYIINQLCVLGLLDPADIFEPSMVQFPTPADYLASTGPNKGFDVSRGNLLNAVLQLLQTEAKADNTTTPVTPAIVPHGIRAIRPNAAGTAIGIQIYVGTDRSETVYFDATRDLLDDGKYLFSKVGSANAAYGVGPTMSAKMFKGATNPTGLARRVILTDASQSGIGDSGILRAEMSQSLSEAHETAMFDGSINQDVSPYTYGVDFNLGDVVRVVGDYGLEEKARITEYIRSEDATGYKAYPTLAALPD